MISDELHRSGGRQNKSGRSKFATQTNAEAFGFSVKALGEMFDDLVQLKLRHEVSDAEREHKRLLQPWRFS